MLGLKKQRDQLKQYQKRINNDLENEKELARKLLKEGKKDRAKLLLRKKKFQEGLLEKTDSQLDQLERLVHDIEFAQVQKQVIDGLKNGNVALEKANAMFSVDEIEDIFADTQEAVERQAEINSLLSGELTEVSDRLQNIKITNNIRNSSLRVFSHAHCSVLSESLVIILICSQDDENDVLAELDQLIGADLEPTIGSELPSVPDTEPETIGDKLPNVPTQVL